MPYTVSVKRLFNYYSCDLSKGQASKRFQMNVGIVQHTGLQSTQTRRNTGKQGAQTRGTHSAHLPKHPYISGCSACLITTKQFFFQFFVTLNISVSYNYHAAIDVGMLGKMCRVSAPCLCTLLTSVPSCLCCFVGLYAGHPYIHLI